MNIHEYQAKAILKSYGLPVTDGRSVLRAADAKLAAAELHGPVWVVKAQIHSGGRGTGHFLEPEAGERGGVRLARSADEAAQEAGRMLGRTLVTEQTGPKGKTVNRVYIENGADIAREMYLALLIDRKKGQISFLVAPEGGVDVEDVATRDPDNFLTFNVDPVTGIQPYHGRMVAFALHLEQHQIRQCVDIVKKLYTAFIDKDCEMLEINPLVVNWDGDLHCVDAKMSFDPNALFRQRELLDLRDESEEDPNALAAAKHDLKYIPLDGEIGCLVNGAGLSMATMDLINLKGSTPASFLDVGVGGNASPEKVTEAFRIIANEPNIRGILVNVFGGIMRCDAIAEGVVTAVRALKLDLPLVVRLEGTNVDEGKRILTESNLNIIAADNLNDATDKIIEAVRQNSGSDHEPRALEQLHAP